MNCGRNRLGGRSCVGLVALLITIGCREEGLQPAAAVQPELTSALESAERANVIVSFRQPEGFGGATAAVRRELVEQIGRDVRSRAGAELSVTHRYREVPALAGSVSLAALDRLLGDPAVAAVKLDTAGRGFLAESVPASGADQVASRYGLTGKGVRVATLDTGAQLDHPDLAGAIVAQQCFTTGNCGTWGANTGETAEDTSGHGTSIAGVIASRGKVAPAGFAPEAELVVVKVLGSSGVGVSSDWVAALEWVASSADMLGIDIVNISFGTGPLYDSIEECDLAQRELASAVQRLIDMGVIVIAAVGNLGSTTGVASPACNSGVIAVGAAYDADVGAQPPNAPSYRSLSGGFADCHDDRTEAGQPACFNNVGTRLDAIVASVPMTSSSLRSGSSTTLGTSVSSAAVSGIAALARQCNPELSQAQLREALIETGLPRLDAVTGRSIPLVQALELVRSVCPGLPVATPPADAGSASPSSPGEADDAGPGSLPVDAGPRSSSPLGRRFTGGAPAPPVAGPGRNDPEPARDAGDRAAPEAGPPEPAAEPAPNDRGSGARIAARAQTESKNDYSCRSSGEGSEAPTLPALVVVALALRRRARLRSALAAHGGAAVGRAIELSAALRAAADRPSGAAYSGERPG